MSTSLPYFFPETLALREQLTERQRARHFTLQDLDWLDAVYLASHTARATLDTPMTVETVFLNPKGQTAIELAGAFIMSPASEGGAFLYTPSRGLEKFDSQQTLKSELIKWLKIPAQATGLLRYLSIAQRNTFNPANEFMLSTRVIQGAVFEEQQRIITQSQLQNAQDLLNELVEFPSCTSMIEQYLNTKLAESFPGVDQRETRVNSFVTERTSDASSASVSNVRRVSTQSLSETVLAYHVSNAWPVGQTRVFTNPKRTLESDPANRNVNDNLLWERSVPGLAAGLTEHLKDQLNAFWQHKLTTGQSRQDFFVEAMRDKYSASLLDQRQQTTISARQYQTLMTLLMIDATISGPSSNPPRVEKIRLTELGKQSTDLCSTLIISTPDEPQSHAFLYTQARGLQVFYNHAEVKTDLLDTLKTIGKRDELLSYVARSERTILQGLGSPSIVTVPVSGSVFRDMLLDIAKKQLQNLDYALGLYRQSKGTIDIDALIDNVLDIRAMVGNRLLTLNSQARWSTHLAPSWSESSSAESTSSKPTTSVLESAKQSLQRLEILNADIEKQLATQPSIQRSATTLLNTKLAALEPGDLWAPNIYVNRYSSPPTGSETRQPESSLNLIEHFLARISEQADHLDDSPNVGFFGAPSAGVSLKIPGLDVQTFNALVDNTLEDFPVHLRQVWNSIPNLQPALVTAMLAGLRGELQLRTLNQTLRSVDRAIVETVLNSLEPHTRHGLNGFLPGAFCLMLKATEENTLASLANCFLLTERGGLDPVHSGRIVLWTPQWGIETFNSLSLFKTELNRRLLSEDERPALLENLKQPERSAHHVYSLDSLEPIVGNLVENRQQSYATLQAAEVDQVLGSTLSSSQLENEWQVWMTQSLPPTNLQRTMAMAQALITQHSLPGWFGMASVQDQQLQIELLEQYRNNVEADEDYLHGIRSLADFAQEKLSTLLRTTYNPTIHAPDDIKITLTPANTSTPLQLTLAEYALSHHDHMGGTNLKIESRTALALPPEMLAETLTRQVKQLNIGAEYLKHLQTLLAPNSQGLTERQQRFARQLPWQLMQHAHAEMLQKRLTGGAFSFIQQIMDMPDAIARAAVNNARAIIRPLELVASSGATAVKALGLYLIGPQPGTQGPQVLYAPYSQSHHLKEYKDEAGLLAELTAPGALQQWVLRSLPDAARATFAPLLASPAGTTPSISLASNPIKGHLFKQLFTDNIEVLFKLLGCQSIAKAHEAWNAVKHVFTSGVNQALQFIPGKLAYPLVVWNSFKLFKSSAEALQEHHWRRGIGDFVKGAAQMVMLRQSMPEAPEGVPDTPAEVTPLPAPSPSTVDSESSWANIDITAAQRTELQPHEVTDIALQDLHKDSNLGLYRDPITSRQYAPIEGKVFRIGKHGEHWQITNDHDVGPLVYKNARLQWSTRNPLVLGARVVSRITNRAYSNPIARRGMNIHATGMEAIRRLYLRKASMITEALSLATRYVKNSKGNLRLLVSTSPANTQTLKLIKDFFDLQIVEPLHIERIKEVIDDLLSALLAPSLNSPTSKRFAIGSQRRSSRNTKGEVMAFTLIPDSAQRLYLTRSFFKPELGYENLLTAPFNVDAHARAVTLIHELTHQVCQTEDITYLNACHPHLDLVNGNTPIGRMVKASLQEDQRKALSLSTPRHELFQVTNLITGLKTDPQIGSASEVILNHILDITEGQTLDDARRIFRTDPLKRVETILGNADSVALLISKMGRRLESMPSLTGSLEEALGGISTP
ncbi:dermonecrotic toxin domain-containing protein [Pseudomonas sp. NPDC087697]|uniref:dermonecrotic toxin domain-containing protein n=1 Tax=Pseudomonas sp. NPDC087697 TaxID=3364447 RepID=UPI0037F6954F